MLGWPFSLDWLEKGICNTNEHSCKYDFFPICSSQFNFLCDNNAAPSTECPMYIYIFIHVFFIYLYMQGRNKNSDVSFGSEKSKKILV